MSKKKALITGITGQDGSYLAEFLLEMGYDVHGVVRRVAIQDPAVRLERIAGIRDEITLHSASLESYASLFQVVTAVEPDECYHLAAQSFVSTSFEDEFSTITGNVGGAHYMLSALKQVQPDCRFYFAGSSEEFGDAVETPQTEVTPLMPRSAYGISKVAGHHLTRLYREAYGIHASAGLLFNHESPRRGIEFVTRKITDGVAKIQLGQAQKLTLGNLDARRDWGYARDYVRAMWLMLQQDAPDDYVIATGKTWSIREFLERAFSYCGLDWRSYVEVDEAFVRPADIHQLVGDARKAQGVLGWEPVCEFPQLVGMMVTADLHRLEARQPRR